MSETYSIEVIDGYTKIDFFVKPEFSEAQACIDDLALNYPYEKRIYNLGKAGITFTTDEIIAIVVYGKSKLIRPSLVAFVASDDLTFGLMRQLEVYRGDDDSGTQVMVFRTEQEAAHWINQ